MYVLAPGIDVHMFGEIDIMEFFLCNTCACPNHKYSFGKNIFHGFPPRIYHISFVSYLCAIPVLAPVIYIFFLEKYTSMIFFGNTCVCPSATSTLASSLRCWCETVLLGVLVACKIISTCFCANYFCAKPGGGARHILLAIF